MTSIKKLIKNDYVFSVITKLLSVLTGILYSAIYSRYLHSELRGEGSVINNYAELIMLFLCFGIYQAYPFFKKQNRENIYNEFINVVSGLFLFYVIFGIVIGFFFIKNLKVVTILILIPLMFATKNFNYVVLIENPKIRNLSQIFLEIFDIVFIGGMYLFTKANFEFLILVIIVKEFALFIVSFFTLRINPLKIKPSLKKAIPYIRYGIIPMLTVILMEINYKADVLMLEWFSVSKSDIGIYTLGVSLAQKIWLIPDALKDILLSKLAQGRKNDEVAKVTRLSLIITVICTIGLAIIGRFFIILLYGQEYSNAYYVILILLVGVVGMIFYKTVYSYNVINGYKNINFVFLFIAALSNIVANSILIPLFGIYGAAFASSISYLICGIVFLLFFKNKTGIGILKMIMMQKEDFIMLKGVLKKREKEHE